MRANAPQLDLLPLMGLRAIDRSSANDLIVGWKHPLGACARPFGQEQWLLELAGEPIAVAVSASTVSATVAGFARQEVVELARIARSPEHPQILRVMLRLWRSYLAPRWSYWPIIAAVSYALPGTPGDLYRFDGWRREGAVKASSGGGTWSKDPNVRKIADGRKTLWVYRYAERGEVSTMTDDSNVEQIPVKNDIDQKIGEAEIDTTPKAPATPPAEPASVESVEIADQA